MDNVLVLNSDYSPIHVCSLKRAVQLMLSDRVDVLETYDKTIHGRNIELQSPSVVRLRYYVKKPYHTVPLSRRNVLARDRHVCQYCGATEHLTIDHVMPKSRGGKSTWENLVTCCSRCNCKKGDRTPEEAGLKLRSNPRKPVAITLIGANKRHESWKDYMLS